MFRIKTPHLSPGCTAAGWTILAVCVIAGIFWIYGRYQQKPVALAGPRPAAETAGTARARETGKYVKVLAIDDGGAGVIPALQCLARIEEKSGKPVCELFDLMVGTASGGFVVAALAAPGNDGKPLYSARALLEEFPKIHTRAHRTSAAHPLLSLGGRTAPRYLTAERQKALLEALGKSRLDEALTTVILPSFSVSDNVPFLFASDMGKSAPVSNAGGPSPVEAGDYSLAEAVIASTGNPAFFAPSRITNLSGDQTKVFTDASFYAANPTLLALGEALLRYPGKSCVIISLGAGVPPEPTGKIKHGWDSSGSAPAIVKSAREASAGTVSQLASSLLRFGSGPVAAYVRLEANLPETIPPGDTSQKSFSVLMEAGTKLVGEKSAVLDRTADFLSSN